MKLPTSHTGLRGLGALGIFLGHLLMRAEPMVLYCVSHFVTLFVVLSGYTIAAAYVDRKVMGKIDGRFPQKMFADCVSQRFHLHFFLY